MNNSKGYKLSKETRRKMSKNHVGMKGKTHTEEAKRNMSIAQKKRKHEPHTEETKRKISKANKGKIRTRKMKLKMSENHADQSGKNNPMYGKKLSKETKLKLSKASSGKNNGMFGRKQSKKTKRKISQRLTGNKNFLGKTHSEETKRKMSKSAIKRLMRDKPSLYMNTLPELLLKIILNKHQIKYVHQYNTKCDHLADFYLPSYNLIIEVDGDYWHNLKNIKTRDKRNNKAMKNLGYNVLRLKEKEIKKYPNKCIMKIISNSRLQNA